MTIPLDILRDWQAFVHDWCADALPEYSPPEVQTAFDALRRLWPEFVLSLETRADSGLAVVAPAIALGLDLATCEHVPGFDEILTRLRGGEEAASAEIEVAGALLRCGLSLELEPHLLGKRLDSVISIGQEQVFVEVIAPETSEAMKDAYAALREVGEAIVERRVGVRVEVLAAADPRSRMRDVVSSAVNVPADGWVRRIAGVGLVRVTPSRGTTVTLAPEIEEPLGAPLLWHLQSRIEAGLATVAMVGLAMQDERAVRLLSAELHHFSRNERNLLVARLTKVPGGIKWWVPVVERWFQPNINTRIGAVVLYFASTHASVRRRWVVIENRFARMPLPPELLDAIRRLDDPLA